MALHGWAALCMLSLVAFLCFMGERGHHELRHVPIRSMRITTVDLFWMSFLS